MVERRSIPNRTPFPVIPGNRGGLRSPTVNGMMREVLHTLGNIDFQHQIELAGLDRDSAGDAIRKRVRIAHRERREPYVELLALLRKRQSRNP